MSNAGRTAEPVPPGSNIPEPTRSHDSGGGTDSGASIARFTSVVGVFKFVCFSLGFIVKILFSRYFPTSVTDSYFWAQESFFNIFTIGEDLLGSSYLPVFVHARVAQGDKVAWRYTSTVLLLQAIVALTAAGTLLVDRKSVV